MVAEVLMVGCRLFHRLTEEWEEWFVFKDQEAVKCLSSLHDRYVIVPADKASTISCLYVNHITSNA